MVRMTPMVRTVAARLVPVVAVAIALAVLPAAPSGAATRFSTTNDYETANRTRTYFDWVGDSDGYLELNRAEAEGGDGFATVRAAGGYWSGVRNPVLILDNATCDLSVYVKPLNGPTTLNIEVIEDDSWSYIALKTVKLSGATWQKVSMSFRTGAVSDPDAWFRVSVVAPSGGGSTPPSAMASVDTFRNDCQDF
jgi:hypothetical protein